jgi:D-proline reductase (dithiol) PrdB
LAEQRTLKEKIGNWVFGIPAVAQLWARLMVRRTSGAGSSPGKIPFARLSKPLSKSCIALITTGGIHLPDQPPFDMENPDGDAGYREIPGDLALADLTITHKYYNHESADRDPQVIFPLEHFRDLVSRGILGSIAPRHFGFMGHIEGEQLPQLLNQSAPALAKKLREDGVDLVFLTPA